MSLTEPELALSIAVRMAAVAFALSATEQLWVRSRAFGPFGPFSEAMARIFERGVERNLLTRCAFPFALPTCLVASLCVVVLGPFATIGWGAMVIALGANWFVQRRRVMASDGAEQMSTLIMVAAALAMAPVVNHPPIMVAVWFIGGQGILAYIASGLTKAFSPAWRSGTAIATILGSEAHGHPYASRLLNTYPTIGIVTTRFVIVFECCFGLLLLGPTELAAAALLIGLLFHAACAVLMGLNTFIWAFPATYACVWIVSAYLSPWR
ncbi:MAG TPA: hypothetical protein VJU86_21590 [Pyrinomonadaceae bacterium]|nr:hypothetical protein [Pyrinomonadaceae bacterium]